MSNVINKSVVYSFLAQKKSEVIDKIIKPIDENKEKEKVLFLDKLTKDFDLDKLVVDTKKVAKTYEDIRDSAHYSYGTIYNITNNLKNIENVESVRSAVANCIEWRKIELVCKLTDLSESKRHEINTEYKKLDLMVKSCSTGNKAVRLLKEIGFDTSTIVNETPKNEVMAINVNKKVLGI